MSRRSRGTSGCPPSATANAATGPNVSACRCTRSRLTKAALAEQGVPYSWGGGNAHGPSRGTCCSDGGQDGRQVTGFDCSGLVLFAYAQAEITLPRTAAAQAGVGRRIPASAGLSTLRPGDLVFYVYVAGNDASIYHVALYLGSGRQVAAPRPGLGGEVEPVATTGYAGGAAIL